MADNSYHFRNALGGYHKGDVTGYIEKVAAQHRNELLELEQIITTLREENHSLQQQLNLLMMSTPIASTPEAKEEKAAEPASEPVSAPAKESLSAPELASLELQAYRRAEAMERNANNRARKLYRQMEDLCDDALEEFQATDSAVKQTLRSIMDQANSLEQAYQTLSAALQVSREKLAAMNELISDAEEDSSL